MTKGHRANFVFVSSTMMVHGGFQFQYTALHPSVTTGIGHYAYSVGNIIIYLWLPHSKVRGDNMGPIWGRQDPGGPDVGPMNFAIWVFLQTWFNNLMS